MRKNEIIKQIETLGYSEFKNVFQTIYTKAFSIHADKEFHISLEFENDVLDSSGFTLTICYGNVGNWATLVESHIGNVGNWTTLVESHIRYVDVNDDVISILQEKYEAASKMLEKALVKINEIIMTGMC